MNRKQTQMKRGDRDKDTEDVRPDGDHHYDEVWNLRPSRKIKKKMSFNYESYSDTDSDASEEAQTELQIRKEQRKNADKLFKQYENYKMFNVPELYQAMGISTQKSDKRYVLANSTNWKSMWGAALNVVGKKKYTALLQSVRNPKNSDVSETKEERPDCRHGQETLPPLVPQSRQEDIKNSPLLKHKQRSLSSDQAVNDDSDEDEASISSSVDTTASNRILKERSRLRRMKTLEIKEQEGAERERRAMMAQLTAGSNHAVLSMPPPSHSQSSLLTRKYGATSHKYRDETVVLRRIGRALEEFSRQERRDLIERGNVELLELTTMRTRLQMFLNITISAHEAEALFKKFDPNKMGSVNIADIYGNAMSSVKKKKPKMGKSRALSGKSTRSRKNSRDSAMSSRSNSDWGSTGGSFELTREVVVSTELDEKVDSVGQLDGNIRCTVLVNRKHSQQNTHDDEDDDEAKEIMEDNAVDLSRTMRVDMHDSSSGEIVEDEHAFDEFIETLTPDLGMSTTMNVREFNTLEESDSVSSICLCSIDEDIQEEDEEEEVEEQDMKESIEQSTPGKSDEMVVAAAANTGSTSVTEPNYNDDSFEECTSTGGLEDQNVVI